MLDGTNKCLDVPSSNFVPHQPVQIFTCHGEINQQWALAYFPHQVSGGIRYFQRFQSKGNPRLCLSWETSVIELDECSDLTRPWMFFRSQFINPYLGQFEFLARPQCVERDSDRIPPRQLRIGHCSFSNSDLRQRFYVWNPNSDAPSTAIYAFPPLEVGQPFETSCWDVPNGDIEDPYEAVPIQMFPCHGGINQQWVISEGGTIRYQRDQTFCVAVNTVSKLALSQECDTTAVQWVIRGEFGNPDDFGALCAEALGSSNGAPVEIRRCTGTTSQRWLFWP
jgi:hypothetical protein